MFILKFLKPKVIVFSLFLILLGYFIFRLETLNASYNDLKNIESDSLTVSAKTLDRKVMVSEILKGDLSEIEERYLLKQIDYSVPFSYTDNIEFFDELNNKYFKDFLGLFIEKEFKTKLISDVALGIDFTKVEFEETEEYLKVTYNSNILLNVDNKFDESFFNIDVGLFRTDFSESDRALILDDMNKYVEESVLEDTDLTDTFKTSLHDYLENKINQIFEKYNVNKKLEIEINFKNIK